MLQHTPDKLMRYFDLRRNMSGAGALADEPLEQEQTTTLVSLCEDRVVLRRRPIPEDLRPGPVWAGPALLSYVDSAGFIMTVAHLPPGSDALTVDLAIKFLRPAPVADLIAEARLLRLSKHRSDIAVTISSARSLDGPVAHATATFAPRPPRPVGTCSS